MEKSLLANASPHLEMQPGLHFAASEKINTIMPLQFFQQKFK